MKKIALINDLSGFGKCSLTAAIPVISVLGIQACPLPTAILSAQTGFGDFYCDDFTDRMSSFAEKWKGMQVVFDGIYSGYLASPQQVQKIYEFLGQFREKDTLYLMDPVMGDSGRTIRVFSEELLQGMKGLAAMADVITPNLTELCLLADEEYFDITAHRHEDDYIKRIQDVCQKLLVKAKRPQTIIVTGILQEKDNEERIGNLAVAKDDSFYLDTSYTGMGFSGTGDLFASVVSGCLVKGLSVKQSVEKAVHFLQAAIEDATLENIPRNHGVQFEKYLSMLI